MKKFSYLIMFLAVLVFASGLSGCKKESNDDPPKPTPTPVKPKPDPEKPEEKPAAQQLYNEALNDIKQSHDYTTAVQKLTQAAEQNADSANLVLAYMYEYGVGVEQDIAKAKEYYAKEVAINQDGYATEKLASFNENANNCKLVLPVGCNLRKNEILLVCGDSVLMANGDGSFNNASRLLVAKNTDNKIVSISLRPSSASENKCIDALESAVTLMFLSLPYAFEMDEKNCELCRKELLSLEETHLLAKEIENQLVNNGSFDYVSLSPWILKGCEAIYASVDNRVTPQTNQLTSKKGEVAGDDPNKPINLSPEYKNDVRTTITSSVYNSETVSWDVSLNIKNMSSLPFLAVPGRVDADGFHEKDFWANFQFVSSNTDVADIGGSIVGFFRNQINYFKCCNELKPEEVSHYQSDGFFDGIYGTLYDFVSKYGLGQKAYREKYMKVETDMDITVESAADEVMYYFPFCGETDNDVMVDVYYLVFNIALPIFEIVDNITSFDELSEAIDKLDEANVKELKVKTKKDIVVDICKKLLTDQEFWTDVNRLINYVADNKKSLFSEGYVAFQDLLYKLYYTTLVGAIDGVCDNFHAYVKLFGGNFDTETKVVKSSVKQAGKLSEKVYDNGAKLNTLLELDIAVEKVIDQLIPTVKQVLLVADITNAICGIYVGLIDRFCLDYTSFEVKFTFEDLPFNINVEPINDVSKKVPAVLTANTNKYANISIYANDKLVAQKENTMSLKFDLSTLIPGTYNISVQASAYGFDEFKKCDFECIVSDVIPILEIDAPVLSSLFFVDPDDYPCFFFPCNLGDDMSINITSSILCDISVLVNGKEVGSKNSTKEYSVSLPTDQPGTFKVVVKGKTEYTESPDILFTYAVTKPDTPVTPSGSLPSVSGTNLESTTSHTGGTAPDVKGQNIDQTYSTGTAPDVKGQNLDDSYSGQGTAPDAKGQKL